MIVKVIPSPEQLRWWLQSALSGFDTLDPEGAADNAKSDLVAALQYLDALDGADDPMAVFGLGPVESRVGLKVVGGKP